MCVDPVSIGLMAVSVAGAAVSARAQQAAASGEAAQATYAANVARYNAHNANMEGAAKVEQMDAQARSFMASQRAAGAASGVNPDVGSPGLAINETDRNRYLDTVSTLWNSNSAADSFKQQAAASDMRAANARTAGKYSAAGTFLGGLASGIGQLKPRGTYTDSLRIG